nr:integrase, catalytic region, zinc finger, CCHC-type, peptidase aspartic, catalytic [Tanacetum cinerariifolium]
VVHIVLWYLDSGFSKHMTENRSQLMNFVSKFLGTVRFGNDQIARIMGYGDYQLGNVVISRLMQHKKPDLSFLHVFRSLCYPINDHEDLGKFDAKVDIGIFVGYVPVKKAFRIYNRRTRIISKTIHVTLDELTTMASEQFSLGPGLHVMTPATPFQEAVAPRAEVLADSSVLISISQDAPSTRIPSSQVQEHSPIIS